MTLALPATAPADAPAEAWGDAWASTAAGGHTPDSPPFFARFDPRLPVLGSFAVLLTAVTTPAAAPTQVFAGYALLILLGFRLGRLPLGPVFRRLLNMLPLVAVIALPLWLIPPVAPNPLCTSQQFAASVACKAGVGLLAALFLTVALPFETLLAALDRLAVPRLFLTLLHLTRQNLEILRAEAQRMERARLARGYRARWLWQAGSTGRLIGALFLRSAARGERLHQAMLARGFDGVSLTGVATANPVGPSAWTWRETALLLATLAVLILLRLGAV